MATITKATLAARVLQHLGVLATGQSPSAEDSTVTEEAIDAAHAKLRRYGLVPFATSAIPEWAQIPLRDYVAGDIATMFGRGGEFDARAKSAEQELAKQVAGYKHPLPVRTEYF